MKPLFLFTVFLVIASHQVVYAEDSERIRHLEGEIKAMKQATLDQDKEIRSLEGRVGSQGLTWSKTESSAAGAINNTDDGQVSPKKRRAKDSANQNYID